MTPPKRKQLEDPAAATEPEAATMAGGILMDPGPAVDPEADPLEPDPAASSSSSSGTEPPVIEVMPPEAVGPVTVEQAVMLMRTVWGVAHHATKLTGGPDDAFEPTERELRDQAVPLVEIANRYPWLALIIRRSPYLAAGVAIGGYAGTELERVAKHRRGDPIDLADGPTPAAPPPASFGVRPAGEPVGMREPPRPGPPPTVSGGGH